MSETAQNTQNARPSDTAIIAVQQEEINRLNDNRVYLQAVLRELQTEALEEISRLKARITELEGEQA